MLEFALFACFALLVAAVVMLAISLRRDASLGVTTRLDALHAGDEKIERALREELRASRLELAQRVDQLTATNEQRLEALRRSVESKLGEIREDNARRLEQMRATVDEKLHGVLERRLNESFKSVSERLEAVHKGLGEMQTLATGVGDLKKVLTNVKTRGNWGEMQLGALLEQMLAPDQFARNVATRPGSNERVEFAVKLPGRGEDRDGCVWLPIDAKFPQEDYQRLIDASERGDLVAVEAATRELVARVRGFAKDVQRKYLEPPHTTDFALMFLPTEGLYAEIVRRGDLVDALQREQRIVVAGPTTLAALLNSLQMGFRTLAIEERSSEISKVLGEVKTEFARYGDVLGKVKEKLDQASRTIEEEVSRRTRAIQRKLRDVEALPSPAAPPLLVDSTLDDDPLSPAPLSDRAAPPDAPERGATARGSRLRSCPAPRRSPCEAIR
jgi:DNA recombination protein RmuC